MVIAHCGDSPWSKSPVELADLSSVEHKYLSCGGGSSTPSTTAVLTIQHFGPHRGIALGKIEGLKGGSSLPVLETFAEIKLCYSDPNK
jgi:hypothetical protein